MCFHMRDDTCILPFFENVVSSKVAERLFHNPQFVLHWAHDGYCVILIQRLNLTAFAVKHMEHPWKLDKSKSASNLW